MNYYQKTILYAYPNLHRFINGLDDLIEKRAVNSFYDLTSCESQVEKILSLMESKNLLIELKLKIDEILCTFTPDEIMCFEYKYFKRKTKSYFEGFDTQGRSYFRKQIRLLNKFSKILLRKGLDEKWFSKYLKISFISTVYDRVIQIDESLQKSKLKIIA